MSKVDRRILKTREAVTSAFIELMSEKKFEDITIQNISDRANMNRGTIYLHYVDKYDLLDKCIAAQLEELLEVCSASDQEQGSIELMDSFLPVFQYFERNYLFYSTMLVNQGTSYFHERFLHVILQGLHEEVKIDGAINKGLNKDIVIPFVGSAFVGLVEWWIKEGMPFPPQLMAEHVKILLGRHLL
ncbi:TetR/AcrR family transcriptional regulator [Paenibacillus profundus]|uniref:TetR/AcrR family transcriptional regulator n=1 Tax=Paenibacillus profundus TaxID=1173085 RepID=A0ABS8YK21_9BACL|nr:TetR/AcrR family transcriptional regulator [Paenibacillus profundus]MCE5172233.1 TetR/AcrR family transcriptional regulator [Paenibacillus profundus]